MKITLFTSNQFRHNYFINLLSENCDELFVVQECSTIFPGLISDHYKSSEIMKEYFEKVKVAEKEVFGETYIKIKKKNLNILSLRAGDLNNCSLKKLSNFLKSDLYIVFGSSYIKSDLVDYLISKKAINIHMGISPYYRGTDCNFWALFDNNSHLVGATIHRLSVAIDGGDIINHCLSNVKTNEFIYTMSTVKSAFKSIVENIKDCKILKMQTIKQNRDLEIRYSKKIDFNEKTLLQFKDKNIDLKSSKFDKNFFKDPFILKDI